MTIQITKPEVEALINQRLQSGGFTASIRNANKYLFIMSSPEDLSSS